MSTETNRNWSRRRKSLIIAAVVLLAVVAVPYLWSVVFRGEYSGFAQPACCTYGSNKGSIGDQATQAQPNKIDAAIDSALTYYEQKYNDSSVTASAKDYGCHVEIIISKNGHPIKALTYLNGKIYEQQ